MDLVARSEVKTGTIKDAALKEAAFVTAADAQKLQVRTPTGFFRRPHSSLQRGGGSTDTNHIIRRHVATSVPTA